MKANVTLAKVRNLFFNKEVSLFFALYSYNIQSHRNMIWKLKWSFKQTSYNLEVMYDAQEIALNY